MNTFKIRAWFAFVTQYQLFSDREPDALFTQNMRSANFETYTQARTLHKQTQIELINFLVHSMLCLFDFIKEEAEQKNNTLMIRNLQRCEQKRGE